MDGMPEAATWALLIPIVAIIGGFVLAGLGIYSGIRRREFEHRERLAMIEKGLTPSDQALSDVARLERINTILPLATQSGGAERIRRGGVILIGIGIGIGFLIWMTGDEPNAALGVGGFLVILGLALYLSSYMGGGGRRDAGPNAQQGSGGRSS